MNIGDSFTMAVPPNYDRPHLYFVISDPQIHGGLYHIVNITTDVLRAGRECVLQANEHPWIKRESFVSFSDVIEVTADVHKMITALLGTKVVMQPALGAETLKKIRDSGHASKAIEQRFKKYLKD